MVTMTVGNVTLNHEISDLAKRNVNREIKFIISQTGDVNEISTMFKDLINNYNASASNCTLKGMDSEAMRRAEIAHGFDAVYEAWLSSKSVNSNPTTEAEILRRLMFDLDEDA